MRRIVLIIPRVTEDYAYAICGRMRTILGITGLLSREKIRVLVQSYVVSIICCM